MEIKVNNTRINLKKLVSSIILVNNTKYSIEILN